MAKLLYLCSMTIFVANVYGNNDTLKPVSNKTNEIVNTSTTTEINSFTPSAIGNATYTEIKSVIPTSSAIPVTSAKVIFEIETEHPDNKKILRIEGSESVETTTEEQYTTVFIPSIHSYDESVWCSMQPNSYHCDEITTLRRRNIGGYRSRRSNSRRTTKFVYYFDIKSQSCRASQINGCADSLNAFDSLTECYAVCKQASRLPSDLPLETSCYLQPDFGLCNDYNPMWYFDVSRRRCFGFSYSGCAGNSNKFNDRKSCERICYEYVKYNTA